jgi:hypothetical protein
MITSDSTIMTDEDDEIDQMQWVIEGRCKECGASPSRSRTGTFTNHKGMCMPCFWDYKRHEGDKKTT